VGSLTHPVHLAPRTSSLLLALTPALAKPLLLLRSRNHTTSSFSQALVVFSTPVRATQRSFTTPAYKGSGDHVNCQEKAS